MNENTLPPWLPIIPSHWQVERAGRIARHVHRSPDGATGVVTAFRDGEVTLRSNRRIDGFTEAIKETGYQGVRRGDLVIHSMDGFAGAIGVSDSDGKMSPVVHIYRIEYDNPHFIAQSLRVAASSGFIQSLAKGIRERSTSFDKPMFKSMLIPRPPKTEQDLIVAFLDRETARIDTLIEEQQRLIDLLRERRISLITRQVAGGYLEDFSRTQSNWYPNLPSSWQFGRVKSFATRVTDGAHISPNTNGGVYDFVSTRDINAGNIDYDGSLKTSPETYEHMVRTGCRPELGDVLFSKDGTVGETAIVDEHREFVVASSLVIISPDPARLMSEFLAYALMSKASRDQAASMMRGAGLPRISVANLGRLELPLPPLEQQRRIVNDLNDHTAMLDTLIAETEKFVDLARERRAALITAAVTGQIDVRDEVA
ncbi:restriction endonuclease subunit S [Gordonia phosphorivorans]|uniref:Restriction endonuclease subunit S n=1 Tax=Gordonia phosphorivorans TaxID=1056982 RepID=A0ABV6H781_9ACTN